MIITTVRIMSEPDHLYSFYEKLIIEYSLNWIE